MQFFKKYRTLWMAGIVVVIAILFIINFSFVVEGVKLLLRSVTALAGGAALAFILNLIMDPTETKLLQSKHPFLRKRARSLALLASFLAALCVVALVMSVVIPNMINALKMLTSEAPRYFTEIDDLLQKALVKYPDLARQLEGMKIEWNQIFEIVMRFITKGAGDQNVMDSTINLVSNIMSGLVNLFIVIVFAAYVLSDKERFVKAYYTLTDLFMPAGKRVHLTRNLRIINQSFKSFIVGEIIEACILSAMVIVGMLILRLPYATMIGILVGVINMIPMIGAFIGGGIGAFIIFTISPTKCLIFLIFLCVIQQIESNIFFPRVIGNKVGLPGIYVMITIVVGGSLFSVAGMILGVPLMASLYKITKDYLAELKARKTAKADHPDGPDETSDGDPVKDELKNLLEETGKEHAPAPATR